MDESRHTYHVFLSHSSVDKPQVEDIARQLKQRGITAFLDKWHLIPGEPWQEALEKALDDSQTCAVFLGAHGMGPWENEEMRSALEERVDRKEFRVIPVLLPGADVADRSLLPRFLRRLTWVDFRAGRSAEAMDRLVAGILGYSPGPGDVEESNSDLGAGIIHALPPAPSFIGRTKELSSLHEFWKEDSGFNVASLIGLGGAGKTAIAAEFLSQIVSDRNSRPDELFVWSFYVDQEANNFLRSAYQFFTGEDETGASGLGLLSKLVAVLSKKGRTLLIMDGLERVQKEFSDMKGVFGQLEDPLLRQIVSRLALGIGNAKCLITSRFPVSDLSPWRNRNYKSFDIDQLEPADARSLLRIRGVEGSDGMLDEVVAEFGSHALTLDHLATYLAEFCGGDPTKAHELEEPRIDSDMREERKLARVLSAYEQVLKPTELDLLMRFCIFRSGVSIETIFQLFGTENANDERSSGSLKNLPINDFRRLTKRLADLHLLLHESEQSYTAHPAVRDHFYRLFRDSRSIHGVVEKAFTELLGFDVDDEWKRVSDQHHILHSRLVDLRRQDEYIRGESINLANQIREFLKAHPKTVMGAFKQRLTDAAVKIESDQIPDWPKIGSIWGRHFPSVTGFSELEHSYNSWLELKTWNRAEKESGLKEQDQLVRLLHEFSSRFSSRIHTEMAREIARTLEKANKGFEFKLPELQLAHARLGVRPGISVPEDPATLNLIEELIYHSIQAGNIKQALQLYEGRLGGLSHLSRSIGEYARGARVLRSFPECPKKYDLAWYLRGIGDLEGAAAIFTDVHAIWTGTLNCLRGLLPRVADDLTVWSSTRLIARFLSGRTDGEILRGDIGWGEAVIISELHLLRGDFDRARSSDPATGNPEFVRKKLVLAEIERLLGNLSQARAEIDNVSPWILRSGSVEHLCLFHLVLARILTDENRFAAAKSELSEGLHLAQRCGFALYHIDLLNEKSRSLLRLARSQQDKNHSLDDAANAAMAALNGILKDDDQVAPANDINLEDLSAIGAQHPECQYIWGEIQALSLLGEISFERGDRDNAVRMLQQAIDKQKQIQHPRLSETTTLLRRVQTA